MPASFSVASSSSGMSRARRTVLIWFCCNHSAICCDRSGVHSHLDKFQGELFDTVSRRRALGMASQRSKSLEEIPEPDQDAIIQFLVNRDEGTRVPAPRSVFDLLHCEGTALEPFIHAVTRVLAQYPDEHIKVAEQTDYLDSFDIMLIRAKSRSAFREVFLQSPLSGPLRIK